MKTTGTKDRQEMKTGLVTRRQFTGFFILGSLVSLLRRKSPSVRQDKEALFWKKTDGS